MQVNFLFHMSPLRSDILILLFSLVTCAILLTHLFLNPYSDVTERMKKYIYIYIKNSSQITRRMNHWCVFKLQSRNKKSEPLMCFKLQSRNKKSEPLVCFKLQSLNKKNEPLMCFKLQSRNKKSEPLVCFKLQSRNKKNEPLVCF